ncbi:MAG: FAD-dependent thymidylate synthase, partial [Candidatus Aenigmarchaeota archaeon]|nr:FAD-dependent thymidylate synthase [Candidatus Aenigmarchaeota archaeon]
MDIYCIKTEDGLLLHPSIQATVLAKYSRSPDSARNTYLGLSEEEADKFHSKWTISYGHSSVAELAVIPLCFEGISMIASKFIEKYQRAGYSEKSTRYQKFSRDSFINPTGNTTLSNFINRYYDAYEELYPLALENASKIMGGASKDLSKVKARAFDSIRYLLPAGTGTNLAAVMNLRDIRYLISEAKGHSNPEIRKIGESVQKAASDICPSLIGEVLEDNWEPKLVYLKSSKNTGSGVRLLNHNPDNNLQFRKFLWDNYSISYDQLDELMKTRGNRRVPQAFRMIDVVLEITMDYGAYRDLQRHRRCEQFSEILTPY